MKLRNLPYHRLAVFCGLLSLVLLILGVFLPVMLVANAMDGAHFYSILSSVGMLKSRGLGFLAAVIFTFSVIFPVAKLLLLLTAAAGGRWLTPEVRKRLLAVTEWSAKYSMLDVFVVALLVLLIKVDEFVKMLPSVGLYVFFASIFMGAVAGAFLRRAMKCEEQPVTVKSFWKRHLVNWLLLVVGAVLCGWGGGLLRANVGGYVSEISLSNLTNRPMPRSFERLMSLKELTKPESSLFSRDTLRLLVDALQAATTDGGWQKQVGYLRVTTADGTVFNTPEQPVDFSNPQVQLTFGLGGSLRLDEIQSIEFNTRVEFAGLLPAELTEERLEASADWSRRYHRQWYGRIFQYNLAGMEAPGKVRGIWLLGVGCLGAFWGLSGLLVGRRG
jgi:paraquat-inducible protein A